MTSLTDTQVVTASGGLVELGYVQRTSDYIVNSTTVAGAANVFASNLTIVSDGSPFLIEFNCGRAVTSSGGPYINIYLVDGSGNSIAMMNLLFPGGTQAAAHCQIRIQPPAGTYSYNVRTIYSGAGSASLAGGTGTGGNQSPILLRASKIVTATQWPAVTTGTIICTSTTRPASPFEGQTIYETDTDLEQRWTGSAWVVSGSNGGSFLSASSTTTVSAASTITYTQASITLTPGVWEVTSAMTLINGTTTDSAAVAIYNQTAAAVVSGSYGTPGYTSTTWAAALQSMPTKMTVTSNTQVCPYGNRNGGSTIAPASGVGAPVGLITARRLYGG